MTRRARIGLRAVAALGLAGLLAACENTGEVYREHSSYLTDIGMLRTETAPPDAPFTNADLSRNFITIALNNEYAPGDKVVEKRTPSVLNRWEGPILWTIQGEQVGAADRREVSRLMGRIARLSGLRIRAARPADKPNFYIMFLNAEERRRFVADYRTRLGEGRASFVANWADDISYPCIAQIYGSQDNDQLTIIEHSIVLIKSEIEGLYRKSCIHEEVVQAMGLQNDDDDVRPSIFNDDEEFALLTRHDEYLLQMLYDDRLQVGMNAADVAPLLDDIVSDLRPEDDVTG